MRVPARVVAVPEPSSSLDPAGGVSAEIMTTDYHAKYDAHLLTRRSASDRMEKLGASLLNATVDLNPHQIDAALFAFRSPLSRGAILADEVGLGKTIEAGLIVSQLWAERSRRILIIVPTTLRNQWAQELGGKFFIPSIVLDSRAWAAQEKAGSANPFEASGTAVICSYQFARARGPAISAVDWDLVVIDEAHRLRNVYKPGNKIARAIKDAVQRHPKVLLTATPLQNTLLELYGLVGFLDEHLFGGLPAFRARYMQGPLDARHFAELKRRLAPVCQRTLRRQVGEYVRYTQRIPITQDFTPTSEEQRLYDGVSAYLLRAKLHALPSSQRKLMTLVLRKLLASSTFAIAGTLQALLDRLHGLRARAEASSVALEEDFESLPGMAEEWTEEEDAAPTPDEAEATLAEITAEIDELAGHKDLATSITRNSKGQALLSALNQGFKTLFELGANRKAVIFTESRRTQTYLLDLLEANGYSGQVMTLNGTNTDHRSSDIYKAWKHRHAGDAAVTGSKAVDLRAALIEHFRDEAAIMVATEAAAEGVNLQFCSLVVNYDLPWNPQRIEQRIGRCHRYGQKHDVVVINFLNRKNEADQRVFQILSEKFRLFDGVFGVSDEVLGALESGVDFEKRIADIYQSCRTPTEIDAAFDALQSDLQEQIGAQMATTRAQLLENFDEDVHRRLRLHLNEAQTQLDRLHAALWRLTRHELGAVAQFDDSALAFDLAAPPLGVSAAAGRYRLVMGADDTGGAHVYRAGHPLAESLIDQARARRLEPSEVVFEYGRHKPIGRVSLVERLQGMSGVLRLDRVTVVALEREDHLVFAGTLDSGESLDQEQCEKLMGISGRVVGPATISSETVKSLEDCRQSAQIGILAEVAERNGKFFDEEMEKLERWAEDVKDGLEREVKDLDLEIRTAKREARLEVTLEAKVSLQRKVKALETERNDKRKALFEAQDEIDGRKETLIAAVEARLKQTVEAETLFTIRWRVA